ncbi:putative sis domain-containing protein [Phaeoacremonium minimum UCRPA7]|uniref:Putative sis domain-containing protein n=1 Tax=Phaeoacremonium minimum (strain UCR-PA7) TaxID=1286976 RepID=R8BU53_PHAM7|nr:putative sis domain-containing protein [Phaeoacremonium minimum UCRPA7]EOO02907.1 putative sis domain-containing protein [Phaeoacremonium minimum UCRPA7]
MVEHHRPVQTSAVYILGAAQFPAIPPPSPPSPVTPEASELCTPIEALDLDQAGPAEDLEEEEEEGEIPEYDERLAGAIHVLSTEATALQSLTSLYATDRTVRDGFNKAVEAITRHQGDRGKLVVVGVGKSGHIAKKLVATFNSLAIHANFLHPTEALHGDLGQIGRHDTIMFITFSGKTPELLTLLPHIDRSLPLIVLTSHTRPEACELVRQRPDIILLPAPIHEPETVSFGVSAPTTSTTMALAVGDALAIVASREIHPSVCSVFAKNHPGGAIGAAFKKPQTVKELAVSWHDIPCVGGGGAKAKAKGKRPGPVTAGDVLKAGYASETGWVRVHDEEVVSPRRMQRLSASELARPLDELPWLAVGRRNFISLCSSTRPQRALDWIQSIQLSGEDGEDACDADSIIAVLEKGEIVGVLEVAQLLEANLA